MGQAPMAPKAAPNQNTASLQSTNTGVHAPNTVQAGAPNLNPNSLNKTSEVREFLKKLAMSMNPVMSATKMNVKSSLPGVKMPGAATPKIKMPSVSQKSAPNTMNVGPPAMGAQAGMQTPALPQPGVTAGAPTMGSNINPTPNPAQTSQMTGSGPGANKMASLGRVLSGEMYLKPPKKKKGVGIPVPKATGTGSSLKKLSAWSKRAAYYGNGFGVVNPTDTTIQSEPVPKELQMDPNPNPLTAPTEHEYKKYRSRAVPPKRDSTFPHPGVARPQSALWSNNMMHGVFLEEPRVENPGAMDTMMGPGNQPYSTDMADTSMMAPEEQFMEGSPGTNEGGAGPLQTA